MGYTDCLSIDICRLPLYSFVRQDNQVRNEGLCCSKTRRGGTINETTMVPISDGNSEPVAQVPRITGPL